MALTIYTEIDNSYTATGSGTSSSPYNFTQFLAHFLSLNDDCDYLFSGTRVTTPSISVYIDITNTGADHPISVSFNPSNIQNPPVFVCTNESYQGIIKISPQQGYVTLTINPTIVFCTDSFQLYFENYTEELYPSKCTLNTCYVIFANDVEFRTTDLGPNIHYIKVNGSTFVPLSSWCYFYFFLNNGYNFFNDCYFFKRPSSDPGAELFFFNIRAAFDASEFNRCTFAEASSIWVVISSPSETLDLTDLLGSDNITDHIPVSTPITDYSVITYANKEMLLSSAFAIPVIVEQAIIDTWILGGYDTGLFGSTRSGVGAFYFEEYEEDEEDEDTSLVERVRLRIIEQFKLRSTED